jgi:hypothetical protein
MFCHNIIVVDKYTYLGLLLDEHLNFNITAKWFVQRAGRRALRLPTAKCKAIGGVPNGVFKNSCDSLVWPVTSYCASIWATKSFSKVNEK